MSDMIDVDDRHDELQRVGDEAVARTPRTRELSTLAPAELRLRHGLRAAVLEQKTQTIPDCPARQVASKLDGGKFRTISLRAASGKEWIQQEQLRTEIRPKHSSVSRPSCIDLLLINF